MFLSNRVCRNHLSALESAQVSELLAMKSFTKNQSIFLNLSFKPIPKAAVGTSTFELMQLEPWSCQRNPLNAMEHIGPHSFTSHCMIYHISISYHSISNFLHNLLFLTFDITTQVSQFAPAPAPRSRSL